MYQCRRVLCGRHGIPRMIGWLWFAFCFPESSTCSCRSSRSLDGNDCIKDQQDDLYLLKRSKRSKSCCHMEDGKNVVTYFGTRQNRHTSKHATDRWTWINCWDDKSVEEIKQSLHACGVFMLIPIFNLANNDIGNSLNDMSRSA